MDLIKQEKNEISKPDTFRGVVDDFGPQDLLTQTIILMQHNANAVKEGKAKAGDFVTTGDFAVIGDGKTGIDVIFLSQYKSWIVYDNSGPKKKYLVTEPHTAADSSRPYHDERVIDGRTVATINDLTYNFFLLTTKEGKPSTTPLIFRFGGSKAKVAKHLLSKFAGLYEDRGLVSYRVVCKLTVVSESNGEETWLTLAPSFVRAELSEAETRAVNTWLPVVRLISKDRKFISAGSPQEGEADTEAPTSQGAPEAPPESSEPPPEMYEADAGAYQSKSFKF